MVVVFDVIGTLFSLEKVKAEFRENEILAQAFELWFAKLLQTAMAATLAGKYAPFSALARSTLEQVFALQSLPDSPVEAVLAGLRHLEPWKDASECLRTLRSHGHRLVALTNSGIEDTERLLADSGLRAEFERVYSADDVRACKPHPAAYEQIFRSMFVGPYECCMVAAHGWDILGAESIGMKTIYINRIERRWPFPGSPAGFIVSSLRDVPFALSSGFEPPESKEAAA